MIFGCCRQPNCWLAKWGFLMYVQMGTNSIIKDAIRKPEQKKDAKKRCNKRCIKKEAKKYMQKKEAKNKMQKRDAKNMQKEKPCNRKYASEKIQKWHKTDIKSLSQISQGY